MMPGMRSGKLQNKSRVMDSSDNLVAQSCTPYFVIFDYSSYLLLKLFDIRTGFSLIKETCLVQFVVMLFPSPFNNQSWNTAISCILMCWLVSMSFVFLNNSEYLTNQLSFSLLLSYPDIFVQPWGFQCVYLVYVSLIYLIFE